MPLDEPKLRKLVAIDPAAPLSRVALGRKLAEAEHLSFANEHAPDHLATYPVLGDALIRLGRTDDARRVLAAGLPRAEAVGQGMGRDLAPAMRVMLDGLGTV